MTEEREIILCIPGPWETRKDLMEALIHAHNGRYLFAGMVVFDTEDKDAVTIEWEPHDPRIEAAFSPCKGHPETMQAIAAHRSVVYAHFSMSVPDQRERLLKYTDVLRKAGGAAVKIETCGLSHPWERWFDWLSSPFSGDQYLAVVVLAGDSEGWYSCGMHHFGLPDAMVNDGRPDVPDTLQAFNKYLLIESPDLRTGSTFSKDNDSPRRRLRWAEDDVFDPTDLFHNPHGRWHLDPIS